ncbi:hypothetical protein RJ640_000055 [Escallonia rubra]|uniref:Uncharacterized protein n=1 Tax=Escallonia rubra TaxID=112253 RepID=A0AA88US85_9ASTE|nr:hypothetical protein RJ640_000055 [Escallonia rubra]
MDEDGGVLKSVAVTACAAMTLLYVAILYAPTAILRLPPPSSFKSFMIRRFACAAVSSALSVVVCAFLLPIKRWNGSSFFGVYGIRLDHFWQSVLFPLSLTSLMYVGSFFLKSLILLSSWKEHRNQGGDFLLNYIKDGLQNCISWMLSVASNVSVWRNYIVNPVARSNSSRTSIGSVTRNRAKDEIVIPNRMGAPVSKPLAKPHFQLKEAIILDRERRGIRIQNS